MSTAGFSAGATLVIAFHYALGYYNVLNFAICLVGDVIFFFFFFLVYFYSFGNCFDNLQYFNEIDSLDATCAP